MSLGRIDEALDCCNRCLAYDTDNLGIKDLRERALTVKKDTDRKERDKQERLRKEGEAKMKMQIAFRVRFFGLPFLWSRTHFLSQGTQLDQFAKTRWFN
jgi:hypothetical protein